MAGETKPTTTPKLREAYAKPKNKTKGTWVRHIGAVKLHNLSKEELDTVFDRLLELKEYNTLEEFFIWKRPKE